ncbi:MAG: hypothetical protein GF353_18580 [Candidatus Lokiarchaeota archaeon]|nr:hypothetical protein [Candidatus Lokiarchaeota archaeon]
MEYRSGRALSSVPMLGKIRMNGVIVISDKYDEAYSRDGINLLWRTAAQCQ